LAESYPQSAYAGLQFAQRVVDGIGDRFTDVQAITHANLDEKNDVRLLLCGLPAKHASLALPDPTKLAPSNYKAST
jgi:hypothetical protein